MKYTIGMHRLDRGVIKKKQNKGEKRVGAKKNPNASPLADVLLLYVQ